MYWSFLANLFPEIDLQRTVILTCIYLHRCQFLGFGDFITLCAIFNLRDLIKKERIFINYDLINAIKIYRGIVLQVLRLERYSLFRKNLFLYWRFKFPHFLPGKRCSIKYNCFTLIRRINTKYDVMTVIM